MLVREIMTCPALSIHADADLDAAIQLLAGKRVTALPVVDEHEHLVGVLSEIDVLRRAVEPDTRAHAIPVQQTAPLPKTVSEIMTTSPHTTTEGADVTDLIELFTKTSVKSLPVVRGPKLIGVVSRSDIIRALWRTDADLLDDLRSAFHDYGQDSWKISVEHGVVKVGGVGSSRERDIAAAIARSVLGVRRVHVIEPEDPAA
ncbi:CBS domain-containing protein [Gephyromycinifex aptenodytis]|uniref:CBS domain-containing protein n=1 Tax=Gephyromycinifex aptenodytis TaxID=2716227 RepID=UPI00144760B9|nr:CBS domain-containing protein [Gephyromycinifex aptenodytis]